MNTLNERAVWRVWALTQLNVPVKIIGRGGPGPPGPFQCYSSVLNCTLLHDNIFVYMNVFLSNQLTFKTLIVKNETSIIFPEDLELFPVVLQATGMSSSCIWYACAGIVVWMHAIKTWTGLMKWNTYQGHEFEKPFAVVVIFLKAHDAWC